MKFETEYSKIIEKIESFDPRTYKKTRNFLNGQVSHLSPYITAGVVSQKQIVDILLNKYTLQDLKDFIFELSWREYFYNIWEEKGDQIFKDLKNHQEYENNQVPKVVLTGKTGVYAIDKEIQNLIETGYMHNHARMWVASLCTNFAKSYWYEPSRWMYYHLLDGDLASNTLSWQWVCGAFSNKKYWFNQDNVNKYSFEKQEKTIIDHQYQDLPNLKTPELLKELTLPNLEMKYPVKESDHILNNGEKIFIHSIETIKFNTKQVFMYHPWNLNPKHTHNSDIDKIFILDQSFFNEFPISSKRLNFYLELCLNISGIKVVIANFEELKEKFLGIEFLTTYHPMLEHFSCMQYPVEKIFPALIGYYPSFFSYWKKAEKYLINFYEGN